MARRMSDVQRRAMWARRARERAYDQMHGRALSLVRFSSMYPGKFDVITSKGKVLGRGLTIEAAEAKAMRAVKRGVR